MTKRILLFTLILFSSCTTQRINRFSTFATAGKSYAGAMTALTQEAGRIAIDADSEHLLQFRDKYTEGERRAIITERDSALQNLLEVLGNIRVHTSLLGRYFDALGELAGSGSATTLSAGMATLVESMGNLHPLLENAAIGELSVKSLVGAASPVILSTFRQKKLQEELRRNAPVIVRELELQKALLQAVSDQMKSDLGLLLQLKNFNQVLQPYIREGQTGKEWKTSRKEVMTTYLSTDAIDKASAAAAQMKATFLDLLQNKATLTGFKTLFEEINALIDLIDKIDESKDN